MKLIYTVILLPILISTVFLSCKNSTDTTTTSSDIQENAQQVGDVMASVDETGGTSGSIASIRKTFDRYAPGQVDEKMIAQILLPQAEAASCTASGTFSICSSNSRVRSFNGCTIGAAVFSGDVTLTWGGASTVCSMNGFNDTITRVPNFTVTGRRGATLAVTKTGTIGQRVTWVSGTGTSKVFSFSNDGINRKFTALGSTLFDQTTSTVTAITVTGTDRTSRILNGGVLRVTNNLTSVTCDYTPSAVTWSSTSCNCPTSGTWSGSCSDGKSTSLSLTGCGTATYTEGSTTESITFDRCGT